MEDLFRDAAAKSKAVLEKLEAWNNRRRFSHEEVTDIHKILALPTNLGDLESYLFVDSLLEGKSIDANSFMVDLDERRTVVSAKKTEDLLEELLNATKTTTAASSSSTTGGNLQQNAELAAEINVLTQAMNGAFDELGSASTTSSSSPVYASAEIPVALVFVILLVRAYWYYKQHSAKLEEGESDSATVGAKELEELNPNGDHDDEYSEELRELELNQKLQNEKRTKQAIADENAQLAEALEAHKETVEKFSSELQHRNERLSMFEKEQDTVKQELSAQIELLQKELKERQQQQQSSLAHKEDLCNDLVSKIQTLTTDLEQHEKLWTNIEGKSKNKEEESRAKVEALKQKLSEEAKGRQMQLDEQEQKRAELAAKVRMLEHEQDSCQQEVGNWTAQSQQVEQEIESQLKLEQAHCAKLNTKLMVFSSELSSREERYTVLENKKVDFEKLSSEELQALQDELKAQLEQRDKLNQAVEEMQKTLQEKKDRCESLKSQLEASKKEVKAVEDRIDNLKGEVVKRETNVAAKLKTFQTELDEQRQQQEAAQKTLEETSTTLKQKQFEFVNLTTRMDLYLKELQNRDEQVAKLEKQLNDKEELATTQMYALRKQLEKQVAERDSWNKTTADLNQLLKDKKAQVVGMTTRMSLFEREHQNRKERVAALEAKIQEKEDAEAVKKEPLKKELQRLQSERDSWLEKTVEIDRLLKETTEQVSGLTTRVKLFRQEVVKREERVGVLQKTLKEKKDAVYADMSPIRQQLESQREQHDSWQSKAAEIARTLSEKKAQCVGLKTRVDLFKRELDKKESVIASIRAKMRDKQEGQGCQVTKLRQQLEEVTKGRDEWKGKTEQINQMLAAKEKECAEVTSELKTLVCDLQEYHRRRTALEQSIKEKKNLFTSRKAALDQERQAAEEHRDSWGDTTNGLIRLLKETESSIVGLKTRSMLFKSELQQREEHVATLKKRFQESGGDYSTRVMQLQEELQAQRERHEEGIEKTFALNRELKSLKEQCMGLTTRCKLFAAEMNSREQRVKEQQAKLDEARRENDEDLEGLRSSLDYLQKQRDDWTQKSAEIDCLLKERESEVVGLSTRLELFMTQLQQYEENISSTDEKMKGVRGMLNHQTLAKEIESLKEERDKWTESTIEIDRLLKSRKAEIIGLRTRSKLFRVELERREEQVKELEEKLSSKEAAFDEKIEPTEKSLKTLVDLRDQWLTTTENLNNMLVEKQEQCLPVSSKLEESIDIVSQCKERIDLLESKLCEEEGFASDTLLNLKRTLDEKEAELRHWSESTKSVESLLQEKTQGVASLNTRLVVFSNELQVRDNAVKSVESKIAERRKEYDSDLAAIQENIKAEQSERDRIIGNTMKMNKHLKSLEETCVGLRTRSKLFENEAKVRDEQVTNLAALLQDKDYIYNGQIKSLNEKISSEEEELKKWTDSTQEMENLLKKTEGECVGLSTRLKLFQLEENKFAGTVALLEGKVKTKEDSATEDLDPVESKLRAEEQERESWTEKTLELNGLLQQKKTEVVGLSTRSKLFKTELNQREEHVARIDAKIKEGEDDFATEVEPLRRELAVQIEERDTWEQSTEKIKSLLEQTQKEVASIPTRLDVFLREQKLREDAVNELETKIREKDNIVAIELGFLLNELQLQQKNRAQWKKTTLDIHRLLKETKEQCAKFTSKLDACKIDLRERQERITTLETKIRDNRDLSNTQLNTLRNEVKVQKGYREKLQKASEDLSRLLQEAEKEYEELSKKLETTYDQTQDLTLQVESLETKVKDKKENTAAQVEQLKEQLSVHLQQRNEWRENTMQMKEELKKKTDLCTRLNAKLGLLKKLKNNENPESSVLSNGNKADITEGQTEDLTAKMATLEKELKVQHKENLDVDRILKEKEEQCSNINSKLEALSSELMNL